MTRYRFGLTTIGFYVVAVIAAILVEGMNFMVSTPLTPFTHLELVLISVAFLIPAIAYYLTERINNKVTISWVMLPACLIFLVIGLYGIWRIPSGEIVLNGMTFDHNVDIWQKAYYSISLFASLFVLYLATAIFSKNIVKANSIKIVCIGVIVVAFFSIFYSIFNETDKYVSIFTPIETAAEYKEIPYIQSFFLNKNSYGQMLLLGMVAVWMLNACKNHWWHGIYMIIFYVAMFFSTALTALVVSAGIFSLYFIFKFLSTVKEHPKRNVALLILVIILVPLSIWGAYQLYLNEVPFFKEFGEFLKQTIVYKDFFTATGRTVIWQRIISLATSDHISLLFGFGYKNFNLLFAEYTYAEIGDFKMVAESGFMQVFGSFGLVGLFLYLGLCVYFMYKCFNLIVHKKAKFGFPAFFCFINLCFYSIFETYVFCDANTIGLVGLFCVICPTLIENNSLANKNNARDYLSNYHNFIDIEPYTPKMTDTMVAVILSLPVCLALLSFIFLFDSRRVYISIGCLVVSLLLFIIFPYLIAVWHKAPTRGWRLTRYIMLPIMMITAPLALFFATYYFFEIEIVLVITFTGFALTLTGEIIWTLLSESNAHEMYDLIINGTIKPNIIPILIFAGVFVVGGYFIREYFSFTYFGIFAYSLLALTSHLIMVWYLPNIPSCRKHLRNSLDEFNKRYLLLQRTNFPKKRIRG